MHFLSTDRSIINVETEVRIYTVVVKRVAARRDRKKLGVEWKKIWDGVPNMFWRRGGVGVTVPDMAMLESKDFTAAKNIYLESIEQCHSASRDLEIE